MILLFGLKIGGGGVKIKLKLRKEKEEGNEEKRESEDNDVEVKELDLGDGTKKLLKFEKKGVKDNENKQIMNNESIASTKSEGETKDQMVIDSKEDIKESQVSTSSDAPPVQNLMPNFEKQLSKLEAEITKNRETIKGLEDRLETLNKDLDDLVSLYEIVSEQMNPFVGLSKVTKQRLEMLEKLTQEFENIKNRIEDIEAFIGKLPTEKDIITEKGREINTTSNTSRIDYAIEMALSNLSFENDIDSIIDRFLEEMKNE